MAGIIAANPELIGVSFAGDEWSNSGVEKKKKKKSGAQLSFIFDNEDVIGADCDEEESEHNFVSAAFAYQDKDKYVTGCVLVSDEITGDFIVEQYKKLSRKIKNIALFDLKNTMHLVPKAFDGEAFNICRQIRDVKIGAYLLNPLKDSYFVDDIARDYLGMTIKSYAERFEKKKLNDVYKEVIQHSSAEAAKALSEYAGSMACVACMSWEKIADELNQSGMSGLFDNIEMPTAYYLYQMEKEGVKADRQVLEDMSKLLQEKILALETDIYDLAGEEFNINSPKQLGVILFEKLKLPFAKKTKTGYSTSADILEKLRTEDPIVDKILDYRQLSKLKSTYADGLVVFIEDDKRIHGKFNQTITATGRISSTEPNLQNIPIRMELGRQLRKVFVPKDGYIFLDADYSQIELRVLAHMSGDEELINAYKNGDDIHRSTASKVFHTPFDEVTDIQRRNAKAVNFGIVYGISAFGLSQDLNISKKEADDIIKQYFATYPAIEAFLNKIVDDAKKNGYSETMFGRRRPVPELSSSNFMQKSFGERIAMNSPIQGTAADIIKIAMIRVARRLEREGLKSRIVLQVHDELLVETLISEKEKVKKILVEEMQNAAELKVPLIAEVEEGADWFEAH